MELIGARTTPSPLGPDRLRLVGEVAYDDRPGEREDYWFDVAAEHASFLSKTGNPWLACLLPLAATLGETLRIPMPVDRLLLRNARELPCIWKSWYPELHRVEVIAEAESESRTGGSRAGSFFTGGVDSFFTALRSTEGGAIPTDDLITVGGFDIPLANLAAFERRRARLGAVAAELGKTLVDVVTNLRQTRLETAGWGRLFHGGALASVGLALEGRYRRLLIPSTHTYGRLVPLGSHPLTDPLFSTTRTEVLHDGATYDRFGKLEYLSRHPVALRNLHVCFRAVSDHNCGSCEKCLRSMTALELLGCLSSAESFPVKRLDVGRVARAYLGHPGLEAYYRPIRAGAVARGRRDVVRAVDRAVKRSRVIRRLMAIPDWLKPRRGLWRAAGPIRRVLLAGEMV